MADQAVIRVGLDDRVVRRNLNNTERRIKNTGKAFGTWDSKIGSATGAIAGFGTRLGIVGAGAGVLVGAFIAINKELGKASVLAAKLEKSLSRSQDVRRRSKLDPLFKDLEDAGRAQRAGLAEAAKIKPSFFSLNPQRDIQKGRQVKRGVRSEFLGATRDAFTADRVRDQETESANEVINAKTKASNLLIAEQAAAKEITRLKEVSTLTERAASINSAAALAAGPRETALQRFDRDQIRRKKELLGLLREQVKLNGLFGAFKGAAQLGELDRSSAAGSARLAGEARAAAEKKKADEQSAAAIGGESRSAGGGFLTAGIVNRALGTRGAEKIAESQLAEAKKGNSKLDRLVEAAEGDASGGSVFT